jgi:predicted TIM-barrel fold metal-dependent hydrolase
VDFDDLALTFPEAKIILAHGDPLGVQPVIAGKHPNVYLDTSFTFTRLVRLIPGLGEEVLLRRTTGVSQLADKILLGSDAAPTFLERFRESVEAVRGLKVPEEVRRKVLGENAARLLGFDRRTAA